jgi:hypothetical protein
MLKAIIFVCIQDAPGGFTVSGQTKGKSGCPIYVDETASSIIQKIGVHTTPMGLIEKT